MKRLSSRSAILAATAMGAVLTTPAMAQDSGSDALDSGAIIVTARRTEERLQDVPISISVYSQADISKRNIVNSADLATYTPSLSVNSKFGPEKASFSIRGFVQDLGTVPSVGVYFADTVAPRSGGATTSGEGAGVGSLFDLQNVQVLKGPQGTLFGRNTTGGAVLLVPNKPTDMLEGYVEGSYGNFDMRRFQAVVNVPLADTFKVRLGVDRMKRDGYIHNLTDIGPSRFNDTDYVAARLSVLAELTPDLENYTIATYTRSDTNGTVPKVIAYNPNSGFGGFAALQIAGEASVGGGWWDVSNTHPNPKNKFTTWQIINTTTWQASDNLTVKNIVSYGQFQEIARQTLEGEYYAIPDGVSPYGTINPFISLIHLGNFPKFKNADEETITEELQLQGRTSDGKLTWQAGGYFEQANPMGYNVQFTPFLLNCVDPYQFQCYGISPTSSSISTPWQKRWYKSRALYAQGTYNFTDQLAVTAGARYTWDSQSYEYDGVGIFFETPFVPSWYCNNPLINGLIVDGVNTGLKKPIAPYDFRQCYAKDTAKSDKPTWTIDLEYKPTNDILLFAKWTRGYRAGGVNPTYVPFNMWGPEKVDTYELGTKTSFYSGSLKGYFNVTGFYNDFRDQQIQATLVAKQGAPLLGGTAIINAGKSRIWGIEVDASVTVADILKIDAGYTYLNTKLQELSGIPDPEPVPWEPGASSWAYVVPTAVVGGPLSLSPRHRLTLTGTVNVPVPESVGKLSVGATFVYTAKQYASRADDTAWANYQNPPAGTVSTDWIVFAGVMPPRNPGLMPSTKLLNLNANWDSIFGSPIDASFFMTNVTNEKFPVNVVNGFNSFGLESQLVNEPRMYGVRLKVRFGA
ncbi:TonB-dependent receptor [Novosphingobium mangrovi (ex Huang et al. 2023)]|uniref:TonB-dependent receptor n=1 Tax=Novosphingobium mangrovi (ex Huang et al. 2023) TaxID=2976432 RepID=A0ABT2I433_9SPHN|nr:TonB-dependent receptor [Novosphingobium mangrovi (ex Huang et al. 2023)]MCT2399342.1 TonB-dependent receptor [Novosphingobium mangrovi (ex Huang et al. 2023)]